MKTMSKELLELVDFIKEQIEDIERQPNTQYFVGANDAYRTVLTKIDLVVNEDERR